MSGSDAYGEEIPTRFGRYEILDVLGQGGMGRVYLGFDPVLDRQVALKVILNLPEKGDDKYSNYLKRFMFEAKATAKLSHPTIVAVYDAGEEEGFPWIAFEFIKGQSLDKLLSQKRHFPLERILSIGRDISTALKHAHGAGLIHRDVKPANILICPDGTAKLADFGISKTHSSTITRDGATLGSPGYMSPEQIKGATIDGRSDIFSLGVVLYELVAGVHPFRRDSVDATVMATISSSHRSLRDLDMTLPMALAEIVDRCLESDVNQRYQFASELSDSLNALVHKSGSSPHLFPDETVPRDVYNSDDQATKTPYESASVLSWITEREPRRSTMVPVSIVVILAAVILGIWLVKPGLNKGGTGISGGTDLPEKTLTRLVNAVQSAPLDEAVTAAVKLANHDSPIPWKRFRDEIQRFLTTNRATEAWEIGQLFQKELPKYAYGNVFTALVALNLQEYPEADRLLELASIQKHGPELIEEMTGDLLMSMAPHLEQDKASDLLLNVIVHRLRATNHAHIRQWSASTSYWLRWNAATILEKGGHTVDYCSLFILDLEHGESWQIRKKAVHELGNLKDIRALPSLEEAREKGIKDPLVAQAAHSVLKKVFGR